MLFNKSQGLAKLIPAVLTIALSNTADCEINVRQVFDRIIENWRQIARNSVESQRLSILIHYATAAPFAIGFLEAALAMEETNIGIWRNPITLRNCRSATRRPEPTHRSI